MAKGGWKLFLAVGMLSGIVAAFFFSNVDVALTDEDEKYLQLIGIEISLPIVASYANVPYPEKIAVISRITSYLYRRTINNRLQAIPIGMEREPRNWYLSPTGICYDLTRVTEKILRYYGFDVRHVAIYSTRETGSALRAFTKRRNPSHAVLEVRTERGWVLVDATAPIVAVSKDGNPISVRDARIKRSDSRSEKSFHPIFSGPYFAVYGLYSRHGMFYPPFNILPDVSWAELVRNWCCVNVQ